MAKVTITDVAREAGVSLGTVSNALNRPSKVKSTTLEAVQRAMDRLGYLPNQSARVLAGGQSKVFGLIIPTLSHGFSLQIANGAHNEALRSGYSLLIANSGGVDEVEQRQIRYFMSTQVAGIMVEPERTIAWQPTNTRSIPTVYLDIRSDKPGYFVAADNFTQGALVAEHALARGARHVVEIGRTEFKKLSLRSEGIHTIMSKNENIRFEHIDEGAWDVAHDGFRIGERLAARPPQDRPDFIIALTDVLATGAIEGVRSMHLSVPEDIAVAGCDGNPLAWSSGVSLTTCAPPGYEIGRRGVQMLIEQIEDRSLALEQGDSQPDRKNHQQLVRPFLLPRASTGCSRPTESDANMDLGSYL